jgi:hypothetical protein
LDSWRDILADFCELRIGNFAAFRIGIAYEIAAVGASLVTLR